MAKAQGIRAGKAFVELGVSDKLTAGLKRAQKQLQAFGAGVRQMGQRLVVAASGVIAPALAATKIFASAGDALNKMSARTGVSVEALSELGFAAEQSGSNLETLETGMRRMVRTVKDAADGSKEAQDALKGIGLSAKQLQGLSPEQQFKTIATALDRVSDASTKAALAQEILGRSGTQLIPLMSGGARAIEGLQEQARQLGLTIDTETAASAAELTDAMNILRKSVRAVAITIGSAIGPVLKEVATSVTRFVTRAIAWVKANRELVVTIFKVAVAVGAIGGTLIALGGTFSLLGYAVGGLVAGIAAMKVAFAVIVGPIGITTAAVAALGFAILKYTKFGGRALEWLGDRFGVLKAFVKDTLGAIVHALGAGDLAAAAGVATAALKVAFMTGIRPIREAWANAWAAIRLAGVSVWSHITGAFRSFRQFMESTFPNLTAAIVETWSSMVFALKSTWAKFQSWLTDQVVKVWGLFDESVDVEGILRLNEQDLRADLDAMEEQHTARVAEAMRKQQRSPAETAAEHALEDAAAEAELLAKELAIAKDLNRDVDAAARALADAHEQLREAKKRAFEATRRDVADIMPRRGMSFEDELRGVVEGVKERISVMGTFNPAAVRALSGGSDRQVKLLSGMDEKLKKIATNQRMYRPSFL